MLRHPFRVLWRLAGFLTVSLLAISHFALLLWLCALDLKSDERTRWSQRWAKKFLQILRIENACSGKIPDQGMLIANHLSYIDILVLSAAQPMIFVAKKEVRSWPIIGWLTRCAGTLFIDRQRRADVADLSHAFQPIVDQGVVLALFPEGTSTGGDKVLPFMSSLFEPAVRHKWSVSTAWIGYSLEDGSVSDEVCYWRDMTFLPHFLNLLSKKKISARVVFGPTVVASSDRKEMAKRLHEQVCALAESSRFSHAEAVERTLISPVEQAAH